MNDTKTIVWLYNHPEGRPIWQVKDNAGKILWEGSSASALIRVAQAANWQVLNGDAK